MMNYNVIHIIFFLKNLKVMVPYPLYSRVFPDHRNYRLGHENDFVFVMSQRENTWQVWITNVSFWLWVDAIASIFNFFNCAEKEAWVGPIMGRFYYPYHNPQAL